MFRKTYLRLHVRLIICETRRLTERLTVFIKCDCLRLHEEPNCLNFLQYVPKLK